MQLIEEQRLRFRFPENIPATKYDNWSFYRNQFTNVCGGAKAVDMICIDDTQVWLIEVKDYRQHRRIKSDELDEEFSCKIRDTLAGLVAAKCNANDGREKKFAEQALTKNRIRIVLHLEQPRKHSKLFPKAFDPSKVLQKMKQRLKAVDPHPYVLDMQSLEKTPQVKWSVQGI